MRRILTDKQIKSAYDEYAHNNVKIKYLSDKLGCSKSVLERWFKKLNLPIKSASDRKKIYSVNESILDIIDTEEKAYWIGFLYADGNVSKTNRVRLSVAKKDLEVVERFSYFIYGTNRVKTYKTPLNKKGQDLVYVDVCNKHLSHRLIELGCPPKKTFILTFPNWIEQKLLHHFIRGYFDGDGCLSNYKTKQFGRAKINKHLIINEYDKSEFSILSTKEFLEELHNIFAKLTINSSISKRHKRRQNNNFTLKVLGNRQIERLMDWIYKDSTIFLRRKYDKYIQLKETNNAS